MNSIIRSRRSSIIRLSGLYCQDERDCDRPISKRHATTPHTPPPCAIQHSASLLVTLLSRKDILKRRVVPHLLRQKLLQLGILRSSWRSRFVYKTTMPPNLNLQRFKIRSDIPCRRIISFTEKHAFCLLNTLRICPSGEHFFMSSSETQFNGELSFGNTQILRGRSMSCLHTFV